MAKELCNKKLIINLTEKQYEKLRKKSFEEHVSMGELIRRNL